RERSISVAALGRLLDRHIDLAEPPVEIGNCVRLGVDPGRQGCVLALDRRGSLSPQAEMRRDQLRIDPRRINEREPYDQTAVGAPGNRVIIPLIEKNAAAPARLTAAA